MKRDVVVIGGGLIGLAIAWRLAERKHRVTLLERGQLAGESSGISAGMLAVSGEADPHSRALAPLKRRSGALFPGFADALEQATGMTVGYARRPSLQVAFSAYEVERLHEAHADARSQSLPSELLDAGEVRRLEPGLSPRIAAGLRFRDDGLVDPARLATALAEGARRAGATLRTHCEATRIVIGGERVQGVETHWERIQSSTVILAAGAWSGSIEGLPAPVCPPTRPVGGQIVTLAEPAVRKGVSPLPRHVIRGPECYLVPHLDGRLTVGATSEEKGFVKEVTAEGLLGLLRAAYELMPGTAELAVQSTGCGLRPASRDPLPILGPCAVRGLFHATGHYRSGILLAPATAEALVAWVEERDPPSEALGFGVERFAEAPHIEEKAPC